jgi:hypothetical protein
MNPQGLVLIVEWTHCGPQEGLQTKTTIMNYYCILHSRDKVWTLNQIRLIHVGGSRGSIMVEAVGRKVPGSRPNEVIELYQFT